MKFKQRGDFVLRLCLLVCVSACAGGSVLLLNGCASAVAAGHNTALDSTDLVAMTDDMAMKIVASPAVQEVYMGIEGE